jgi:hypothetical protein
MAKRLAAVAAGQDLSIWTYIENTSQLPMQEISFASMKVLENHQ